MRKALEVAITLCIAVALFLPLELNGGQTDSGADKKGAVKGVLISSETGKPIAEQVLHLRKFYAKTDKGKPFGMVIFIQKAPSMLTNASGSFKFSDVPVETLNSRLNKAKQKYSLSLGESKKILKNPDGSDLLFEIKPDDVLDLGKLKVMEEKTAQ